MAIGFAKIYKISSKISTDTEESEPKTQVTRVSLWLKVWVIDSKQFCVHRCMHRTIEFTEKGIQRTALGRQNQDESFGTTLSYDSEFPPLPSKRKEPQIESFVHDSTANTVKIIDSPNQMTLLLLLKQDLFSK